MVTLDEVASLAGSLPHVVVGTRWRRRTWLVGTRSFLWERPLTKADMARLGEAAPPAGDIVALKVENLDAKEALLAIGPPGFFTIAHFESYPAVLIALRQARKRDVRRAVLAAWRLVASPAPRSRAPRSRDEAS